MRSDRMIPSPAILPLLSLLLLPPPVLACPDCSTWTGTPADICGYDGITYASDCELFVTLCIQGPLSFGAGMDVNTLPLQAMLTNYKAHDGACSGGGASGGNCPDCSSITNRIPVCDNSLAEYESSCAMVKKMCEEQIISFDDGIDFSTKTEQEYRKEIDIYVNWEGKCFGDCPVGTYSSSGQIGPCTDCPAGSFAATPASTSCELCPLDMYQPDTGSTSCISCPDGKDTLDKGAADVSQCLADCTPGHYSATGNAPCTQCAPGTFSDSSNALSCASCGVGRFTDGVKCEVCPVGHFSSSSTSPTTCMPCSTGHYINMVGATTCQTCTAGTYANVTGSQACTQCGPGTYSGAAGAASCTLCDAGYYQIELGRDFCFKCPEGTFQSGRGASSCTSCAKGYYQEDEGMTSCTKCPDRMTTMTEGSMSRHDCHYTSCMAGDKVVVMNGRVTCHACPAGSYQRRANVTYCDICPKGTYQANEGSTSCSRCPENSITYTTGSTSLDDCEGPKITLYTGKNYGGTQQVLYDKRSELPSNLKGNINSFKVDKGDWYVFSSTWYSNTKLTLKQGVVRSDTSSSSQIPKISGLSRKSFYSIRPVVTNSMCYTEFGKYYTGYRSKTQAGVECQNWTARSPHSTINTHSNVGIGNHNYCRNPDNDVSGPWCYTTDPNKKWDYCGIPKCKWNVDCYTERGELYRGTQTRTAGGSKNCNNWYSNWPHPHSYDTDYNDLHYGTGRHSYCRNPAPNDDNRPWCYTTNIFKRWAYCDVPKCEYSSTSYF